MRLILASASPRRAELLRSAGFAFDVSPVEVDETPQDGEDPAEYVRRLAGLKAETLPLPEVDSVVVAADTTVVVAGRILGKPVDAEDARAMLETLSGREHSVLTGVAVRWREETRSAVEATRVSFLPMSADEIAWYVSSGEPDDKAGAYAVQGLAGRFVDRIDGSYSNVVGLPVARVYLMLSEMLGREGVLAVTGTANAR